MLKVLFIIVHIPHCPTSSSSELVSCLGPHKPAGLKDFVVALGAGDWLGSKLPRSVDKFLKVAL